MNSKSQEAIQLYGTAIEDADEFPYLGSKSKMTSDRSCDVIVGWQVKFTDQDPLVLRVMSLHLFCMVLSHGR